MEKDLFNNASMGGLNRITGIDATDWAFVPAPLSTKRQFSNDLWPILAQAREELARLYGIGRHMSKYERFLKPLPLRDQHSHAMSQSGGRNRLQALIEKLFELPAVTTPQVANMSGVSFPAARSDIETLIRLKL